VWGSWGWLSSNCQQLGGGQSTKQPIRQFNFSASAEAWYSGVKKLKSNLRRMSTDHLGQWRRSQQLADLSDKWTNCSRCDWEKKISWAWLSSSCSEWFIHSKSHIWIGMFMYELLGSVIYVCLCKPFIMTEISKKTPRLNATQIAATCLKTWLFYKTHEDWQCMVRLRANAGARQLNCQRNGWNHWLLLEAFPWQADADWCPILINGRIVVDVIEKKISWAWLSSL